MERQQLGRAVAKASSNTRPQQSLGLGSASLGIQRPQSSNCGSRWSPGIITDSSVCPSYSLGRCWGLGGQWEGRRDWQKQWESEWLQGSCQGKAKEDSGVAAASSLSSCTLQLLMLFRGSERDSPAVSSSRLLGQQGPSSQALAIAVLDLCGFLFVPQTPGFPGQSP